MFSLKTEQKHYLPNDFNLLRIITTDEVCKGTQNTNKSFCYDIILIFSNAIILLFQ